MRESERSGHVGLGSELEARQLVARTSQTPQQPGRWQVPGLGLCRELIGPETRRDAWPAVVSSAMVQCDDAL